MVRRRTRILMETREDHKRKWGLVGFLTLLSRIVGYLRDVVVAALFGAGFQTDAFYVAFRIPNLLRRLFAEGSLAAIFVPIFSEYLESGDRRGAKDALRSAFTVLLIILVFVVVLGVVFSPWLVKLFAYGFDQKTFDLAVYLNRLIFPYVLLISLTALAMGVLNSVRHFFAPAFSPVLFNLCIIASALFLYKELEVPIVSLCFGVLGGGVLQLLLHLFYLREKKFMFGFAKTLNHPAVRKLSVLMFPQLFGIAVYNLNILVNTQYASFMSEGTVSYLYFAERIIEFPLGVVAVSLATVMLPALSGHAARGDHGAFGAEYLRSLRRMLFIMVPAMVGIVALRVPLCNFLYQHGEFDYVAVINTSQAILGYGLGLFAVGGIRITVPAFFALQDTRTPVKVAFFCFLLNAVCGFVLGFIFSLNHLGLALASSISSVANFVLLVILLNGRLGRFLSRDILLFSLRILAIAVVMGFAVSAVAGFSPWSETGFSLDKALVMAASVGVGVILYFLLARLIGIKEVEMFSFMKKG